MELELGLALPNQTPMEMEIKRNKYKFAEAFENGEIEDKKLRLLLWSEQPNEEEDDRRSTVTDINNDRKSQEEENIIPGWQPINSPRKELLHQYQGGDWNIDNFNDNVKNRQKFYVKVKMEGVAIGRKIDLRLFNSYQDLKCTLLNMFNKCTDLKIDRNGSEYTILYQDKEGDWLLAGDVPWETFMESVKRMEIIRNDT